MKMKRMKRGRRVVCAVGEGRQRGTLMKPEGKQVCQVDCMNLCTYSKCACVDGPVWIYMTTPSSHFLALNSTLAKIQISSLYQCTNYLTVPSAKLEFTVGLLIKFNVTLPEGNDIVLQ